MAEQYDMDFNTVLKARLEELQRPDEIKVQTKSITRAVGSTTEERVLTRQSDTDTGSVVAPIQRPRYRDRMSAIHTGDNIFVSGQSIHGPLSCFLDFQSSVYGGDSRPVYKGNSPGFFPRQKKQVKPLKLKGERPEGMDENEWEELDELACSTIMLTLAERIYFNVTEETTTYGVWQKLCRMYEKQSAAFQIYWLKKLVELKMKEGTAMSNHLNEFHRFTVT
ncbi:hypothetical protein L7F22_060634 [Adiantum nelumboides]|nr:hypothetical protein [Adiantum nelumboides]